jgi:tryptophanyl-tRNA synthetase
MKRLFSGMQPTGSPHIGNYLGALKNWITLAEQYDALYCIVDYHAITVEYDPKLLQERIKTMAAVLLGCGLPAPEKCSLFVQSAVPKHAELAWILGSVTPMAELQRMTQFKDKSARHEKNINVDLFSYPVLQAADILIYDGSVVPVGEDQVQHIEFSRIVARKFNNRFGQTFIEPKALVSKGARIMGLDGKTKMSKSLGNHIDLLDPPDTIREKLKTAYTDPNRLRKKDPGDPDICNMFTLHKHFSTEEEQAWAREGCTSAGIGCFQCKKVLGDNIINYLEPIQERTNQWLARPDDLQDILKQGATRCAGLAEETMQRVYKVTGLGQS